MCQIWGQSFNTLNTIQALYYKIVWVMNFRANNYDIGENCDVLKDLQSKTKTTITNKILNSH